MNMYAAAWLKNGIEDQQMNMLIFGRLKLLLFLTQTAPPPHSSKTLFLNQFEVQIIPNGIFWYYCQVFTDVCRA